ncbi:zinc ribbon domain-containing protein [Microseira sp. BLCC-F43]|uniref:zinc ribbon domain-containing protein n=1 Tax=Microseira sp. BLCC-F43 TaxID=3153602 RepID=UPI0035B9A2A5
MKAAVNHYTERTHRCPHCGHIQDRDWNAAINILELALRTVGHTGTLNASFDIDLCLGGATPLSKPSHRKRRASKK